MKARETRVVGAFVMLPATICICLGVLAGGCKKEKAPVTVSEGMPPSPPSAMQPAVPAVVVNPKAVVVSVSGKTLTRGQLEEQLARALASPQFQGLSPEMAPKARQKLEKDITEGFVVQTILEQEADSRKIVAGDKDCDEEMAKMQSSLQGGMSMEQMVTMMGMDMKELKSQIAQELKIRKLLDLQTTNVPAPTAEEVLGFYTNTPAAFQMPTDYVHVRHILVALDNPESVTMPGEEAKPVDEAVK
ncbi:MAG: SurA N-terminal domain-containing protein, partial [bacterium]